MRVAMKRSLLNFIAFQAGWFACVLGAAHGMPWLGLLVVSVVVIEHLLSSARPSRELRLLGLAVLLGLALDSALLMTGWLRYPNGILVPGIAPYWILAMWALFATTLNVSMSWLKGKPLLAALLGAVFGPLSYIAGQRLGALQIVDYEAGILALAAGWAAAMPLLVTLAARLDGSRENRSMARLQALPAGE